MLSEAQKRQMRSLALGHWPHVLAVYLFGSAATHEMRADSDIDLAILTAEKLEPETILTLKGQLGTLFKRDVDIVDLMRADVVTRAQVVAGGDLLACQDARYTALFETTALSQYALLNEERRE